MTDFTFSDSHSHSACSTLANETAAALCQVLFKVYFGLHAATGQRQESWHQQQTAVAVAVQAAARTKITTRTTTMHETTEELSRLDEVVAAVTAAEMLRRVDVGAGRAVVYLPLS